jgi:prolipoprotein diacylglyceryltransferase
LFFFAVGVFRFGFEMKKQNNLEFFCMNTVSQYLKNKKLNVFFLVFETLQVKKANLKWRKTKTVFSFCFLRY